MKWQTQNEDAQNDLQIQNNPNQNPSRVSLKN